MVARRSLQIIFLTLVMSALFAPHPDRGKATGREPLVTPSVSLPLMFEPGRGATSYSARARGYRITVAPGLATLALPAAAARPVELTFEGGRERLHPSGRSRRRSTTWSGRATAGGSAVPAFGAVRINALYPGIDAVFYGSRIRHVRRIRLRPRARR